MTSATSSPAPTSARSDLPSDACALAASFDGERGYVHFAALPPLCFGGRRPWLADRAGDPGQAGIVLERAQEMLNWRLLAAERRLTGCALTPGGVVGSYDPP